MTQWLTLWRAAQLVGVSRGVLQRRIRDGELVSNEGMISSEELLRCYPQEYGTADGIPATYQVVYGEGVKR